MRTEADVKKVLSDAAYKTYLKDHYPKEVKPEDKVYWNPKTGSCGFHARFSLEALGVKGRDDYTLVKPTTIPKILSELDKGKVFSFLHNYPTDAKFSHLPKDNRYGNHMFVLVKGGDKYFVSQGYLHKYRHSLTPMTRSEVETMLKDLITKHSDYDNTKTWGDLDLSLHKKYFHTDLRLFPDLPVKPHRKVNGIVLLVESTNPTN